MRPTGYGSIGLVGAETERPYNRPPLSKGLWKGKAMDRIWRGTNATTEHPDRRDWGTATEQRRPRHFFPGRCGSARSPHPCTPYR